MIVQGPHQLESRDRLFVQVENASATEAIVRGDWVVWDVTDNRAVSGIMTETRGIRVLKAAGTFTNMVYRVAGCAEEASPTTAANNRGRAFLVQCYGYHDGAKVGEFSALAGESWLIYRAYNAANTGLGTMSAIKTPVDILNSAGYAGVILQDSVVDGSFQSVWVRCM